MRFILLTLLLVSCAPAIPLEGAKCPCVEGWYCCPGLEVCAATEARCDAVPGPQVTPAEAEVGVGRKLRFQATGDDVTWELEDGLVGGSVEADGTYRAPSTPGVFHLIARSSFGARRVTVTVRELRLSVLAGEHGGPSDMPIDGVGEGARLASPLGGVLVDGKYYFLDAVGPSTPGEFMGSDPLLRRLDVASGRVETIGGPVSQLLLDIHRPFIFSLVPHGAHELLLVEIGKLEVFDTRTLATRDLGDLAAQPLLQFGSFVASDGVAIYRWNPRHSVLVKWEPGTQERVLAGVMDTPGDQDGAPGLLGEVGDLLFHDGKLFVIDQDGHSLRSIDVNTGAIVTTRRDSAGMMGRLCPAHFGANPGPLEIARDGTPRLNGGILAGQVSGSGCAGESDAMLLITGPDSIRRFSLSAGVDEPLAGRSGGAAGLDDGEGDRARFVLFGGLWTSVRGDTVWFSEPRSKRIRTLTRAGQVTTRFRDVEATSLAVTADHVYAVIDGQVARAPVQGGAWEPMAPAMPMMGLLGALDDGRVVVASPQTVFFIDPTSFTLSAPIAERLGLIPGLIGAGRIAGFDPTGALLFDAAEGVRRLDLDTLQLTTVSPAHGDFPGGYLAIGRDGTLYRYGEDRFLMPFLETFAPSSSGWTRVVGQPFTGAVMPGPVSSAFLHRPAPMEVFDNGDVLVPDLAENVMLVIE